MQACATCAKAKVGCDFNGKPIRVHGKDGKDGAAVGESSKGWEAALASLAALPDIAYELGQIRRSLQDLAEDRRREREEEEEEDAMPFRTMSRKGKEPEKKRRRRE